MMSEIIQRNGITTIAEPGFPNINFENELALLKHEMEKKPPYSVYLIPNAARLEIAKKSRRETLEFINSLTNEVPSDLTRLQSIPSSEVPVMHPRAI